MLHTQVATRTSGGKGQEVTRTTGSRRGAALCLGVLLSVLVACGDNDGSTGTTEAGAAGDDGASGGADSGEIDPCALLDETDIEAEFGDIGPIGEGFQDLDACAWHVNEVIDDPAGDGGTVDLRHNDLATEIYDTPEENFQASRDNDEGSDLWDDGVVDVSGVGDAAYYASAEKQEVVGTTQSHGILVVLSDGVVFSVSAVFLPAIEGTQDRLAALAQVVIDRL